MYKKWLRTRLVKSGTEKQILANLDFIDLPHNNLLWSHILNQDDKTSLFLTYYSFPMYLSKIASLKGFDLINANKYHEEMASEKAKEIVKKILPMPIWEEMFKNTA